MSQCPSCEKISDIVSEVKNHESKLQKKAQKTLMIGMVLTCLCDAWCLTSTKTKVTAFLFILAATFHGSLLTTSCM